MNHSPCDWRDKRRHLDAKLHLKSKRKQHATHIRPNSQRAVPDRSLIASFASGFVRDRAAVLAAIIEPWSNGQTEVQITKLKLVKRQMYGRAKIDLLQARLLGAT